jgi:hypothetical protein
VFPAATAGHFSLRIASGFATATDVFMLAAADTGTAVVAPAAYPNLGFGTVTPYASVVTSATSPAGMSYRISAAAAGTTTPRLANGLLPVGTAAYAGSTSVPPLDPVGGSEQDGSVLTAVVLPAAASYTLTSSGTASSCPAAGVKTVVAAAKTGLVVTLVDKNPKDPVLGQ